MNEIRRKHNIAFGLAACAAVLSIEAAVWVAQTAWHLMPLLLAAGLGTAGYRLGQRRRILPPRGRVQRGTVIGPHDLAGEVARLRAENDQLRAELADARESVRLAWNAASSVPPRPSMPVSADAARMLADPRSGVRPLFPGGDEQ